MTHALLRSSLLLAALFSCASATAELLYVSLPTSVNAVVTYDLAQADATAILNSQQTFISGALITAPQGLVFDREGHLYVANQGNNTIGKFDASGTLLATIGSPATLNDPMGLAMDAAGTLVAANFGSQGPAASSVSRFDAAGNFLGSITNQINRPLGVTVDGAGHLFVGNWFLNTVSEFDAGGAFLATIGSSSEITNPGGLLTGAAGELYVASEGGSVVSVFDASGAYQSTIGSGAGLVSPAGLARDRLGNLYVTSGTDSSNAFISKFNAAGVFQFAWRIPNVSGFLATEPAAVPEIDANAFGTALSCLAGGLALIERKRRS